MNRQVTHCYPLNGRMDNPEVSGVDGILEAYSDAINKATLSGPTFFTEIIETATAIALARPWTPSEQVGIISGSGREKQCPTSGKTL